jgi:hydroxymethylglutaryl-CoA lyase
VCDARDQRRASKYVSGARARRAQLAHAGVAGGFAELLAVLVAHERMMQEARRLRAAEESGDPDLPSGGGEQILTADHDIDALVDIIDAHGELIREVAVAIAGEHVAALLLGLLVARPEPQVSKGLESRRHHDAARGRLALLGRRATGAGIAQLLALGGIAVGARDLAARTGAGVGQLCALKLGETLRVARDIVALAQHRRHIGNEAKPREVLAKRRFVLRAATTAVVVLDAQQHTTPKRSRDAPDPDRIHDVAQVQMASWGGGEARRETAREVGDEHGALCFSVDRTDSFVTIVEVAARDGLQNEKAVLPAATKIAFIDRLSAAGFPVIEATSFVSPKAIPQLADAEAVMAGFTRRAGTRYTVLVPNERGLDRVLALTNRPDGIVVFGSASETFSQKNINCSIAESIERFRPVVSRAKAAGLAVRGTVSCALGCPYEGDIAPDAVARVAQELVALGVDELSIADTIGVGTPEQTVRVFSAVSPVAGTARINGHFHDTYQHALDNIAACLTLGVRSFDSSAAGLGGCPYAPGATGNVATEMVLERISSLGYTHGVDLNAVRAAGAWIRRELATAR